MDNSPRPAPPATPTRRLIKRLALFGPPGIPVSAIVSAKLAAAMGILPMAGLGLSFSLIFIVWLPWTIFASFWLARDYVISNGWDDIPATVFAAFGIFIFQGIVSLAAGLAVGVALS